MNSILIILIFGLLIILRILLLKTQRIHQELVKEKEKSNFASEARDYLLRSVNHELRAPMARMGVDVEMISDHEIARSITGDLRLMTEMIDELMDIEKIKHAKSTASQWPEVDLKELLFDVSQELGLETNELEINVSSGSEKIKGSLFQLKKLFKNLIENAFKYRIEGGLVRIDVKDLHQKKTITILNEGSYIKAEELPFLFEPFFRRKEDQAQKKGFGLGLYLCKEVVDSHNGSIKVSSKKEQGTMFKISFDQN